jgi:putative Mg2+ transporter-C (MgtC) family protein
MDINVEHIERIGAAFIVGAILGFEREYKSKPAGLRTILLITVGSCLFSLLNTLIPTQSPDRIASTVVTGIGFVGAGVIFKEGYNVKGLTTAATIWVASAIGMALGFGEYVLAGSTLLLVLIILVILSKLEQWLSQKEVKTYKFSFKEDQFSFHQLEEYLTSKQIKFERTDLSKCKDELTVEYKLQFKKQQFQNLVEYVIEKKSIVVFERR